MKTIATIFNLILVTVLFGQEHVAENREITFNKNAVHGIAGIGLYVGVTAGYYERIVWQRNRWAVYARGGYGAYTGGWGGGSTENYALVQMGTLIGGKSSHLEMAMGFMIGSSVDGEEFPLTGNLNYRLQKPNGRFLFRIGVGWPELLFVGTGITF